MERNPAIYMQIKLIDDKNVEIKKKPSTNNAIKKISEITGKIQGVIERKNMTKILSNVNTAIHTEMHSSHPHGISLC